MERLKFMKHSTFKNLSVGAPSYKRMILQLRQIFNVIMTIFWVYRNDSKPSVNLLVVFENVSRLHVHSNFYKNRNAIIIANAFSCNYWSLCKISAFYGTSNHARYVVDKFNIFVIIFASTFDRLIFRLHVSWYLSKLTQYTLWLYLVSNNWESFAVLDKYNMN